MKKIVLFLLTIFMGFMAFCGCVPNTGNNSENGSGGSSQGGGTGHLNRKYITHFDGYNQCIIFPAVAWDTTLHKGGKVVNKCNYEDFFVSEGNGSIQVRLHEPDPETNTYWYKGRIEANNGFVSSLTSINEAKRISLDICNPGDTAIEVMVEIESASETMVSVTKLCPPKQWTTIATNIERKTYNIVSWYSITLKNTEESESFTVYMDNFYLEF